MRDFDFNENVQNENDREKKLNLKNVNNLADEKPILWKTTYLKNYWLIWDVTDRNQVKKRKSSPKRIINFIEYFIFLKKQLD